MPRAYFKQRFPLVVTRTLTGLYFETYIIESMLRDSESEYEHILEVKQSICDDDLPFGSVTIA